MDLLLFERYGLDITEENSELIEIALSNQKTVWEKLLKSKNEKIREKGKSEKRQWDIDREILTDRIRRDEYRKEYNKVSQEISDYIRKHGELEPSFAEAASIQGVSAETIKSIYKKSKHTVKYNDLNAVYELAFKINTAQNAFSTLISKLDVSVKEKLSERFNVSSLANMLSVVNCNSAKEIEERSSEISKFVYNELYDKRLLSSDIRDEFLNIFFPTSTKAVSVFKFVSDVNFEKHFGVNSWILFRYIKYTCTLMKSPGEISLREISEIPDSDKVSFMQAMQQSFGISFASNKDANNLDKEKVLPVEVLQGENKLKSGDFKSAESLFERAAKKNPYCWQAYWGLFKANIKAKSNKDIYFPGFLKEIKESERESVYPDYVDYYKAAKRNALLQKTTDVNFDAIEMEYKNADKMNLKFISEIKKLKSEYETESPDNIEYKKGKEIAAQMVENRKAIDRWTHVYFSNETLWVIFAVSGAAMLFPAILLGIVYSVIDSEIMSLIIPLAAIFVFPLLYTIFIFKKIDAGAWLRIPLSVVVFLLNGFLVHVTMDYRVGSIVCSSFGILLLAIGVYGLHRIYSADRKVDKLQKIRKEYIDEFSKCFFENVEDMRKKPQYAQYKISNPNIILEIQEKISDIAKPSST